MSAISMDTHLSFAQTTTPSPSSPSPSTGSGAAGSDAGGSAPSRAALWAGRIVSAVPVLFLAADAAFKLLRAPAAVEGTTQLGYQASVLVGLGIVQVLCLVAYLVPSTAVLGAILWTGYLGGAVATHVRIGNPVATHILSPVYVAVLLWGGLWLRDRRLRDLLPLRRRG